MSASLESVHVVFLDKVSISPDVSAVISLWHLGE